MEWKLQQILVIRDTLIVEDQEQKHVYYKDEIWAKICRVYLKSHHQNERVYKEKRNQFFLPKLFLLPTKKSEILENQEDISLRVNVK